MVAIEPNVPDASRYSMTEAARILGIHRNTLRLHAVQLDIHYAMSRYNGRKYFKGKEIKAFWRKFA